MDIYSGAPGSIYGSLAEAMGWLLQWLKGKADGGGLASKGYERFEGVWAGHQVCLCVIAGFSESLMHLSSLTTDRQGLHRLCVKLRLS